MQLQTKNIAPGVQGIFIKNATFRTTQIQFSFFIPIRKESNAVRFILSDILSTCSNKYKDFFALNFALDRLYDANLKNAVSFKGDTYVMDFSIDVLKDKYALDGESLTLEGCNLLLELLFNPNVENNSFSDEDIQRCKTKLIQHIDSIYSDKRVYAEHRLAQEVFKGDLWEEDCYGQKQDIEVITGKILYDEYKYIMENAYVKICVNSENLPKQLFPTIENYFSSINRTPILNFKNTVPLSPVPNPVYTTENAPITQGKLCIAFSGPEACEPDDSAKTRIFLDCFGGGPYSYLFTNVREKQSLCYYCRASGKYPKGFYYVTSGIEAENYNKAIEGILSQLKLFKTGKIDEYILIASKKALIDAYSGVEDSQSSLTNWYSTQLPETELFTPQEYMNFLNAVTIEDIKKIASTIKLHTIFALLPEENKSTEAVNE